jgi:hypothetical protein
MRKHFLGRILLPSLLLGLTICLLGALEKNAAWAQGATPDPSMMTGNTQLTAPSGMSQADWDRELKHCKDVDPEFGRLSRLSADQLAKQTNPYSEAEIKNCMGMAAPISNQYLPLRPIYNDPIPPVPVASPTPPSNTLNDASLPRLPHRPCQSKETLWHLCNWDPITAFQTRATNMFWVIPFRNFPADA